MTARSSSFLSGCTLALWAGILGYFHFSGRAAAFLTPSFRIYVPIASAVLGVLAVAWFAGLRNTDDACPDDCCGHTTAQNPVGRMLNLFVLVVPLVVATVAAPGAYSRQTVVNRGVIIDASALPAPARDKVQTFDPPLPSAQAQGPTDATLDETAPPESNGVAQVQVIDLVYAAQDPTLRKHVENKKVELLGQLMPATVNNPHGNRFKVIRMFMTCCAADARPIGTLIEINPLPDLPEMSWVRVRGTATFPTENGRQIAVVTAEQVEKSDPPAEAMIY